MPVITRYITAQDRVDVADRVKVGLDEEEIAAFLDMPVERMKRIFRRQLDFNDVEAKFQVLLQLYQAATSGENMNATLFSAKARYGWRDTGAPPVPPKKYEVIITTRFPPEPGSNSTQTRNPDGWVKA